MKLEVFGDGTKGSRGGSMEAGDRFWSANACPRCCAVLGLKYAISRSSRNPGRPYYECGNCGQFLMWASARSNLPKEKEVGGQGRGTKCNEEAIGEEKQSTTLQMWNEMKEVRMTNTIEQGRIYEALKIVIALNIVICSLLVMMMLK